jgi:hypothetical protein
MRYGLICAAALDIKFGTGSKRAFKQNAFDLGTPVGLALLGRKKDFAFRSFFSSPLWLKK